MEQVGRRLKQRSVLELRSGYRTAPLFNSYNGASDCERLGIRHDEIQTGSKVGGASAIATINPRPRLTMTTKGQSTAGLELMFGSSNNQ